MKDIAILVGGPENYLPDLTNTAGENFLWVGVDKGAITLLKKGITPEVALGDFDSISAKELEILQQHVKDVRIYNSDKDDTDTELAVQVALKEFNPTSITIYGATAGRLDHLISNLFLVFQPRFAKYASIIHLVDKQNTLSYFTPGTYTIKKEKNKTYIAFVCLTPVKSLSLYNTKYTLDHADYDYPISLASNEFVGDTASFSFESGMVAVIQSADDAYRN